MVAPASASVAVYVPTDATFSAIVTESVAPSENTGALSLVSWTFTVTVSVSVLVPSEAVSSTVHALESVPAPHPGFSKSGALVNVSAPVEESTVNRPLS